MKKIVKEDLSIERFELPRAEAIKLMEESEQQKEAATPNSKITV